MSTATLSMRRNQNLYRQKSSLRLGSFSVSFVAIAAISVMSLLYLNQITKTNVFGYERNKLVQTKQKLEESKESLEIEAARLKSIQQIQASPTVAAMVPEHQVSYTKR